MGFFDDISSIKGKKGLFTVVLTAIILTIYEIIFFYNVVVPGVEDEMNANIKKVGKHIAHEINERNQILQKQNGVTDVTVAQRTRVIFNDINKGILKTMAEREKILTCVINKYTMYTGVIIVLILMMILYLLWSNIKNTNTNDNTNMTDATLTALFTVIILIAFQVLFYFYGKQYKYPGIVGNEELIWAMIDSIEPFDKSN